MNCVIIDDEPLAREGMQDHISNLPELVLAGSFSNPFDAVPMLQQHKIDLLFLDINMPEISGLQFVKTLLKPPLVIFATAYPQYALDSYELDAVDYLLKPIRFERFAKAVNKARQYTHFLQPNTTDYYAISDMDDTCLYVKTDKKYSKLLVQDILYLEGLKDYVIIHTTEKKIIGSMNLKTLSERLPAQHFARISRSFTVNIRHIDSFDSFYIYIHGNELPIGSGFKDSFFASYIDGKIVRR